MLKYTTMQKTINDKSLEHINRISSNNPYLNKYLLFTDGTVVYVTNQGVAKPFTNEDILNSVVGKNGCPPKDFIKLDIPWSSEYTVGVTIPTNPSLIVGTQMVSGQSCGNEGYNVYSATLINNPTSKYIGCYNANTNNDNMTFIGEKPKNSEANGTYTYDKCMDAAIQGGYQYFGLQNVNTETSKGYCVVSNDLTEIQNYGDASIQYTPIALWSSVTAGTDAISCFVNSDGRVIVWGASGTILWQSPNTPSDCWWGGYVNPDSISGSYGGNCIGKPLNIHCGNPDQNNSYKADGLLNNLHTMLRDEALTQHSNMEDSWSFNPMSKWTGGDPAHCCAKLIDYSYQCGGGSFKSGQNSAGTNINFDCSNEVKNCIFFFVLEDDGNLCLYRGSDPSNNNGKIWCTSTNGKKLSNNPNWVASKGKLGRNYLKIGDKLAHNEWIGSTNGSTRLIMQEDGNLVLYTSEKYEGCKKINDKKFGGQLINSVYKLNARANIDNLGKIGYVDSDSQLKQYPDSMLQFTNDYQIYKNTNSIGNDLTTVQNYGNATTKYNIVALWSSNTVTNEPNNVQLIGTGQLTIQNSDGSFSYNVNSVASGCENWGTITISSATYGGNCNAPIGNVTSQVATDLKCNWNTNCSIPISNQTFGDPAPGCAKSFDIVYKCGGTEFTRNLATAEGQTMIIDCNEHMQTMCQFYLLLNDNGNMSIYRGSDPSKNNDEIWSTSTNGKQISNNPDWVASKGKYGRNYLKTGEVLATNEWIGSTNGSTRLIMQEDGNLVLYTSEKYENTNLTSSIVKDQGECEKACNDNSECGGYVYNNSISTCWLKKHGNFSKQEDNETVFGIRNRVTKGGENCNNKIVNIDSVKYGGYSVGPKMTSETKCLKSFISHEDKVALEDIKSQLSILGQDIATRMEELSNQDNKIHEKLNMNSEQFNKNLEKYRNIIKELQEERNLQSNNNNIEGMTNNLDISDLNGMITDSDLLVLQKNTQYILWSILAVGLLTITINTMK